MSNVNTNVVRRKIFRRRNKNNFAVDLQSKIYYWYSVEDDERYIHSIRRNRNPNENGKLITLELFSVTRITPFDLKSLTTSNVFVWKLLHALGYTR